MNESVHKICNGSRNVRCARFIDIPLDVFFLFGLNVHCTKAANRLFSNSIQCPKILWLFVRASANQKVVVASNSSRSMHIFADGMWHECVNGMNDDNEKFLNWNLF